MVVAHICEVGEGEQPDGGVSFLYQGRTQLQLIILRVSILQILLQVKTVRALGKQSLTEAQAPRPIFIVKDCTVGVTANVSGIVIGAVIYDGPVKKLHVTIVGDAIKVEKIDGVELADVNIQSARRKCGELGQRSSFNFDFVVTERNYLSIP